MVGARADRQVQVGQQVSPSSRLLDIVPLDAVWVEVNFKEGQLANLRLGQPVHMTSDLYGNRFAFSGRLSGIGAGTGSVFSLLPPQNATGNWIKIVQRVPVRIDLDRETLAEHPLRVGLSMTAEVDLHDVSGPRLRETVAADAVRSRTSIFEDLTKAADLRIDEIVARNSGRHGDGVAARQ